MTEKTVSTPVKSVPTSSDSILYLIYLLYKTNILTRLHVRAILAEVKKPTPEDVAKYLVQEADRAI